MSIEEMNRVLMTKEAARLLGLSPSTLATWRCRGSGPPVVRVGRKRVGYRLEDLISYVRQCSEMA